MAVAEVRLVVALVADRLVVGLVADHLVAVRLVGTVRVAVGMVVA